jgi:transposase
VAQAPLAMALRPPGTRETVANDDAGIVDRVTQRHGGSPALRVLEAPGGLQRPVAAALPAAALPVVVVHPRQARDGAQATGQLATTEAREARALAHYAEAIRPAPRPVPDAPPAAQRALLARRRPRIARRTAEPHRLGSASRRRHADSAAPLPWLTARLVPLDDALDTALRASPVWREREDRLRRVPGSGPGWARTRGRALPE